MRSKIFALILAAVLVVTASVSVFAAKNPFSDVPADHWAYDSVINLAAVGLVEGYPDGTYGGTRTMTRYEAAMVFARALARLEALVEEQVVANCSGVKEQITADVLGRLNEVSDELAALILQEFDKLDSGAEELVTRSYFDMVVNKIDDRLGRLTRKIDDLEGDLSSDSFVMTEEAEAVIAALVGELVNEYLDEAAVLAKETIVEQGVIERIVVEDVDEEVVRAIAEEVLAAGLYAVQADVDSNRSYVDMVVSKINDRLGRVTRNVDDLAASYSTDIAAVNGLIGAVQGDVAQLQKALDAQVANLTGTFINGNNEFAAELALLGVRVAELENIYAKLDTRVGDVETSVAALGAAVDGLDQKVAAQEGAQAALKAEVDRVQFSGSVKINGAASSVFDGDDEVSSATGLFGTYKTSGLTPKTELGAKFTARVSDDTVVSLDLAAKADSPMQIGKPDKYVLEISSKTFIEKFAFGTIGGSLGSRFDQYVLATKPDKGVVADLALGELDVYVLGGALSDSKVVALGAKYQSFPALGFSLTGAAVPSFTDGRLTLKDYAVGIGLFGKVASFDYNVKAALDLQDTSLTDNLLVDVGLGASLGILKVKGSWAMAGANFGLGKLAGNAGFIDSDAKTRLRLDANADVFGVALGAGMYSEADTNGDKLINSAMVDAGIGFDFLLPVEVSGAYGWKLNDSDPTTNDIHTKVKVGLGFGLLGLDLGGSFTYVTNYIDGDWRNPGKWKGQDANIVGAHVGYDTDLKGASLGLGYDFELAIPINDTKNDFSNKMSHVVSAKYGFSKDLKLNMGFKRVSFEENSKDITVNEVKAGLEFSF